MPHFPDSGLVERENSDSGYLWVRNRGGNLTSIPVRAQVLPALPASLQELTLDTRPATEDGMSSGYLRALRLRHLTQLTSLTLVRCCRSLDTLLDGAASLSLPMSLVTLRMLQPDWEKSDNSSSSRSYIPGMPLVEVQVQTISFRNIPQATPYELTW